MLIVIKRDWKSILENLLERTKQKVGRILDYYLEYFWKFAKNAICILDEIEKRL